MCRHLLCAKWRHDLPRTNNEYAVVTKQNMYLCKMIIVDSSNVLIWQLHAPLCSFSCCDRKARVASARSLTLAASNNRDHMPWSLYYCLFVLHIFRCFSSHTSCSWWITHSMQHQPRGCNNIPSFLQQTAHSFCAHVLFVKAAPGTTFTSWSQHYFVAIGYKFCNYKYLYVWAVKRNFVLTFLKWKMTCSLLFLLCSL